MCVCMGKYFQMFCLHIVPFPYIQKAAEQEKKQNHTETDKQLGAPVLYRTTLVQVGLVIDTVAMVWLMADNWLQTAASVNNWLQTAASSLITGSRQLPTLITGSRQLPLLNNCPDPDSCLLVTGSRQLPLSDWIQTAAS